MNNGNHCDPLPQNMRTFATGAFRDTNKGKPDFDACLSPQVLRAFVAYQRRCNDAVGRAPDNWQKGIPCDEYMKSAWRHFMEWWTLHRRGEGVTSDALRAGMALLFNLQGYFHEAIKENPELLSND